MSDRYLIGGPASAEEANQPQQAEQREAGSESTLSQDLPEGTYKGKTAAQWREEAARSNQRSSESFQRSDTDGALTQWANDSYARKCHLCAELAEKNGMWEFKALFTLTGALVPDAVWIKTKQNRWVWRIGKGMTASWFNESQALSGAARRRNDAAKGYRLGVIRARGYVGTTGAGRGMSGALSVGYFIGRDENSDIVEIVDDGSQGLMYKDR